MEMFLVNEKPFADFTKNLFFSNFEAVYDIALEFGDLDFVKFIQKYGQNPWFFYSTKSNTGLFYFLFLHDKKLGYQISHNLLRTYISAHMPPSLIKILIENGVDVNCQNGREELTPLMQACACGNYETVKMLLDAGADPKYRNTSNQSVLTLAFQRNSDEIYFLIYEKLFQTYPSDSELLQYIKWLPPMLQNIIKQTPDDRIMLKVTQRLYHFIVDHWHMSASELPVPPKD